MPPRANWKGHLKLSLVSCAVALYPATTTSSRIRFNIINKETGNRVKNEIVDSETGDPVPDEDRVKGYKVEGNQYILFDEEELDKVALESTHTIEIEAFVPLKQVDRIYLDESFYLVPDDKVGQEAFAVIREAMRAEDVVGLAKVVLYRRERLLMLQPRGKGLVGTALRYKNEVRDEQAYFDEIPSIKISKDMLDLAVHIIKSKEAEFDPSQFEDRYENALADLIQAKRAGKKLPAAAPARPSNVINLMDALRKSVKGEGKKQARSAARERSAPRKRMKRAS
jgi:DNA end-binding protein Ku